MQQSAPLVSILLPVYAGEKYIGNVISTVINQIDQDFELIISIDSLSDSSFLIAKEFAALSEKIQIFTHNQRLGMRRNYEFLISKAIGDWITIIGQDDAMMPFAISELRKSIQKVPDLSLLTSRRAYAFWPDTEGKFGKFQFVYPLGRNKVAEISSRKFLKKCLMGIFEYSQGPQLYTGTFVSKSLVDSLIAEQNGVLFPYPIPDVSSSASILLTTENFHFSNLPLFVIGTSGGSTGILIDKTLASKNNSQAVVKTYRMAFKGDNQNFDIPGLGVFSNFSWYLFEAMNNISLSRDIIAPKINAAWILAALRVENSKQQKREAAFRKAFASQKSKLNKNYYSIYTRVLQLKIIKTVLTLNKLFIASYLWAVKRLVIEWNTKNFDMMLSVNETTYKVLKLEKNKEFDAKF
jgi:glycosyltransferase involved in cell wall biosynthesis